MNATQAIEYMRKGGSVKIVNPDIAPINNRGYYRLYRNDEILKLIPDTPCAAMVCGEHPVSGFARMGDRFTFEPYDPNNENN